MQAKGFVLSAGLYAGSAILLRLVGFVVFLWLARTLPVTEYATWGLLYALQTAIVTFGLVGIVESTIGLLKEHADPVERQRLFAAANGVFLVVAAITMVLSAIFFVSPLGARNATLLSGVFAILSGVLLAFAALRSQIVRLNEQHLESLLFSFVAPLCGFLGSAAAFFWDRSVASFFAGSSAGVSLALVAGYFRPGGSAVRFGFSHAGLILKRIQPFVIVALISWLTGYGNNYLINAFFSPIEVARYTFIFNICAVMQLVATSMNQVWSPRFYHVVHQAPLADVDKRNRLFFQLEAVVLGLTGAAMLVLYPFAVRILGGNAANYADMRPQLFFLIEGYILAVALWQAQNYLLAFDKGGKLRDMHVLAGIVGTLCQLLLMWRVGPLGIYLGFLVQMLLRSAGLFIAARRLWKIRMAWQGILAATMLALGGLYFSELLA